MEGLFQSHLLCSICHEILAFATSLDPCSHTFCEDCIFRWKETQNEDIERDGSPNTCPVCRAEILGQARSSAFDRLIEDGMARFLTSEESRARIELMRTRRLHLDKRLDEEKRKRHVREENGGNQSNVPIHIFIEAEGGLGYLMRAMQRDVTPIPIEDMPPLPDTPTSQLGSSIDIQTNEQAPLIDTSGTEEDNLDERVNVGNLGAMEDTQHTQNSLTPAVQNFLEPQSQIQSNSSYETQEADSLLVGINNSGAQDSATRHRNEQQWPFAHLDALSWNTDDECSDERTVSLSKSQYSSRNQNSEGHHNTSFSSVEESSTVLGAEQLEHVHERVLEYEPANRARDENVTLDEEVSMLTRNFDEECNTPMENGIFSSLNSTVEAPFGIRDQRRCELDGNAARNGDESPWTPNSFGSYWPSRTRHSSQTLRQSIDLPTDTVPRRGISPRLTSGVAPFSHWTTDNMPRIEGFDINVPETRSRSDSRLTKVFENMQSEWSDLEEPEDIEM